MKLSMARENTLQNIQNKLDQASHLKSWLVKRGGFVSEKLNVDVSSWGYGLSANSLISNSETLIEVPACCCFTSLSNDPLHDIALSLCMERNKDTKSEFLEFLRVLPADTSHIPALWSTSSLERIKGTQVAADAMDLNGEWSASHKRHTQHPTTDCDCCLEDYLWARATVQGRAYSFSNTKQGDNPVVSFLPYITFANHNDDINETQYPARGNGISYPTSSFLMRSSKRIYPHQAVCTSYGELSFQQKATSFGWIDKTYAKGSYSITVVKVPLKYTMQSKISVLAKEVELRCPTLSHLTPSEINNVEMQRYISKYLQVQISRAVAVFVAQGCHKDQAIHIILQSLSDKFEVLDERSLTDTSILDVLNVRNDSDERVINKIEYDSTKMLIQHLTAS